MPRAWAGATRCPEILVVDVPVSRRACRPRVQPDRAWCAGTGAATVTASRSGSAIIAARAPWARVAPKLRHRSEAELVRGADELAVVGDEHGCACLPSNGLAPG